MDTTQPSKICQYCGAANIRGQFFCSKRCAVRARPVRDPEHRFWSKVEKTASCWVWTGGRFSYGYGCFYVGKAKTKNGMAPAHRTAYEFTYGPIPDGFHVLHHCDNPPCCRPDHLFLGTNRTNSADKVRKRRHTFGEGQTIHKLTDDAVRMIRQLARAGATNHALARQFHVAQPTISLIVRYLAWKHVT